MQLILLSVIFVCCLNTSSGGESSCEVTVNDCNYTLSLSPSNSCHGNSNYGIRSKRSSKEKIEIPSEYIPVVTVLSKKLRRIQNRLTREMAALSTRVLRGVRKIETLMSEDVAKQATKRGISYPTKSCPEGFVTMERWPYCYMFSTFNTTWYEARDFCAAFDSDMVALGSLKEHYIVTFLIKNNNAYKDATGWWTSGTFVAKTKQWMWTSDIDMRPFTFIKWAASEPNESTLQCVLLHKDDDHLWHDDLCTMRYNFICEVSIG